MTAMGYYIQARPPRNRRRHQHFHLQSFHGKDCPYCGRRMLVEFPNPHHHRYCPTRDHIIPRSQGGRTTVIVCMGCNNLKGDMHPVAWLRWVAQEMPDRVEAVRLVFARAGIDVGVRLG